MRPSDIELRLNDVFPHATHLLKPRWKSLNRASGVSSTGFCYAASEAAYHLLGGKSAGWVPQRATYQGPDGSPATHWWLRRGDEICDPTSSQYTALGVDPPYHLGRGSGFLTKRPSRAAAELIRLAGSQTPGLKAA